MKTIIFTFLFSSLIFAPMIGQTIEDGVLTAWADATGAITIPAEATKIGANVFNANKVITSVDFSNVTEIGADAFKATNLTAIDLKNVTIVGGSAFQGCYSLTSITAPNVSAIGNRGFQSTVATQLTFPKVQDIGLYAFYSASNLTSIKLDAVTRIQNYAFDGANKLTTVNLTEASGLTTIGTLNAFPNIATLTIHVYDEDKIALFPAVRNYKVEVGGITSNPELKQTKAFSLCPNPAKDHVKIRVESTDFDKVQVMDITGKILHEQAISGTETIISLGNFTKSIYFVHAGETVQKLIVQ